jgi:hypothetical protein
LLTAVLTPCLPLLTAAPNACWISDRFTTLHGFFVAALAGGAVDANVTVASIAIPPRTATRRPIDEDIGAI